MLGWQDVLDEEGIRPTVANARAHDEFAAAEAARAMLTAADRPTAILCFSDLLALGALRAARSMRLAVPGDVSVVGFDDSPLASRAEPQLTTVRQDVAAKGRLAASALKAAIERSRSGTTGKARHELLPTELVVRESSGSPPS